MNRLLPIAFALALAAAAPAAVCHALLVGGEPGSPVYQRRFQDWLTRSHALLARAGVAPASIRLLSADPTFKAPIVSGPATADAVVAEAKRIAAAAGRDDQFVLVIVGHGTLVEGAPARLLLPGPDLEAAPLAAALAGLKCREQIVINLAGIAGEWIAPFAAAERVTIAASSPGEVPDPVFGEFLLRAFEDGRADGHAGGAKDKAVDCLEAFTWAARESVHWIARLRHNREAGTWRVDGKESVAVFERLFGGFADIPGARRLDPASDRNAADAVPLLQPPDGKLDATWDGRRMIDEHAMLEDCGVAEGVPAMGPAGLTAFPAAEQLQPGWLARRTVLGRPREVAKP